MSTERTNFPRWAVETDATIGAALDITKIDGWGQSGRLGTETVGDHATVLAAVRELKRAGYRAWMSPERSRGTWEAAAEGLALYKFAREGIAGWIHAALEAEMPKTEIARRSGLTRQTVDNIIEREGIDALVKGD